MKMKFLLSVIVIFALISDHIGNCSNSYQTQDVNQAFPSSPLIILPPQPSQPFRNQGSFRSSFPQQRPFQQIPFQQQQSRQIPFQQQQFRQIPFQQQFRQIPFQPAQQQFRTPPPPQPSPGFQFQSIRSQPRFQTLPSGSFQCNYESNNLIDASRDGIGYHFSWCHDGGRSYNWYEATNYCHSLDLGNSVFRPVGINDQGENDFIKNIIAANDIEHIWTGGNRLQTYDWVWCDGSRVTYTDWSLTGGSNVPQPDNREGDEDCLAVLNNVYQDGIVWHDIACSHRKPVICEVDYV